MLRKRHRTGPYALAQTKSPLIPVISLAAVACAVFLLIWALRALMSVFDIGNAIEREAVILSMENRGSVRVSLSGEDPRIADADLKLYPEDSIITDKGAPAALSFFDGSDIRLEKGGSLVITESAKGVKKSKITVSLKSGTLWMRTPEHSSYSGTIMRMVVASAYSASIPSGAEVLLAQDHVDVYSADGVGVMVSIKGIADSVIIGEGQSYTVPQENEATNDPYQHRSPITAAPGNFVVESRLKSIPGSQPQTVSAEPEALLTITEPKDDTTMRTATLRVRGAVGAGVDMVRVNGYKAVLDEKTHSYDIEIVPPDAQEITITVEALGKDGTILIKLTRTVHRDRTPPASPEILAPSGNGSTYQTGREEVEIRGTAPKGTTGIIVNDYRLQLFTEGEEEWSYLASTKLQNFSQGENVYRVVAVNAAGYRSDPAVLVIILGEGEEGVIHAGSAGSSVSSAGETLPMSLPKNDPLMPGMLQITSPSPGTAHRTILSGTGLELLIEGTVPSGTTSVWVNNYQLKLFKAGKTFFNYIASTSLSTLKRGENPYEIITRDKDGKILDRLLYTITVTRE